MLRKEQQSREGKKTKLSQLKLYDEEQQWVSFGVVKPTESDNNNNKANNNKDNGLT